jgi:hypothetical protein
MAAYFGTSQLDIVGFENIPSPITIPSFAAKTSLPTASWQQSDGSPIVIVDAATAATAYTKYAGWIYLAQYQAPTTATDPEPTSE